MTYKNLLYFLSGNKNLLSFKENRFINAGPEKAPKPAAAAKKTPAATLKAAALKERQAAKEITTEGMDETVKRREILLTLDQVKFDEILEGKAIEETSIDISTLDPEEVEKLVLFCNESEENENFDKLLEKIKTKEILSDKLTRTSLEILIDYFQKNKKALDIIVNSILKLSSARATTELIKSVQVAEGSKEILKQIFKQVKDNKALFGQIDVEALGILIKTIGYKKVIAKTSLNQKTALLGTEILTEENKKALLAELMKSPFYIKKAIAEDEKLDSKLRKDVYETLDERSDEVKDPEAAKAPEKPKEERTSVDEAGIEITGTRIQFVIEGVERSFIKTPAFIQRLENTKTADEAKLACYERLLRIITKDHSIDVRHEDYNKYEIAGDKDFENSNIKLKSEIEILKNEIAKLKGAPVEPATAPTARPAVAATTPTAKTTTEPATAPARPAAAATPARRKAATSTPAQLAPTPALPLKKEDLPKALTTLETAGLKLKETKPGGLETLNIDQHETLKSVAAELNDAFTTDKDALAILAALRETGRELGKKLAKLNPKTKRFETNLEVEFTPKNAKTSLIWSATNEANYGLGNENDLIDKIFRIKREQLGYESKEFKEFHQLSASAQVEAEKEQRKNERIAKYREKYKELTTKSFKLDGRIGTLWEGEISEKWTRFNGHQPVDKIMKKYPFGLSTHRIRNVAAAIISEGKNGLVYFEDIFKFMRGFPLVDRKKIPENLLKDGGKFLETYNKLMRKPSPTAEERARLECMFNEIMVPCLELMDAMRHMRFEEEIKPEEEKLPWEEEWLTPERIPYRGIAKGQEKTVEALTTLFTYSENPADAWSVLMAWLAGAESAETEIPMSRIDGTRYKVDEGMFSRHYSPHSALLALVNKPGMYSLDKEGKKVLNKKELVKEINRILHRGYVQILLHESLKTGKSVEDLKKEARFNENLYKISEIEDIANFKEGEEGEINQFMAFQLGFINDKINQSEEKIREVTEVITEDTPPAVREILEELSKKIPPEQLEKVKSVLLGMGYIHFHNGKAVGAGFGTAISLGEGYSLVLGAGANWSETGPPVLVGVGLNIEVFKDEKSVVQVTPITVNFTGIGAGISGVHEIAQGVDFGWGVGGGVSFWNGVGGAIGTGLTLSWEKAMIQAQEESLTDEAIEESGLTKEAWEKWDSLNDNEKWALIQTIPAFPRIEEAMKMYPDTLTVNNVIQGISSHIEKIKGERIYEEMCAMPFIPSGGGFAVGLGLGALALGAGPLGSLALVLIGGVKFQIGSTTVFVPHPSEESKILDQISNAAIEMKVRKYFDDLKTGKAEFKFTEKTPNIYYRPGSTLGIGTRVGNKTEVSFSFKGIETGLESQNKALKPAEIRLIPTPDDKRIELVVDNDDDKDIEIHLDPLLQGLALIRDQKTGRIFIEGEIGKIIVTRERFEFPTAVEYGQTSMRDIITIRQAGSLAGKRDRLWMEDNESRYLEKTLGQEAYYRKKGANWESGRINILNVEGYAEGTVPKEYKHALKHYEEHREEEIIDTNKRERMDSQVSNMFGALGMKLEKEYQQKTLEPKELENRLTKLYKDKAFFNKFKKNQNLGNPDKIADLIVKFGKKHGLGKISEKEINIGITFMLNKWFTTLYKGTEGKKLSDREKKKINQKLIKRLNVVRKFVEKKYLEEFKKVEKKLDPLITSGPEAMVKRFMDDIYGDMIKALEKTPPIDFRTIFKVGEGLEQGDILVSGTRAIERGEKVRALGTTLNYEKVTTPSELVHGYGFLTAEATKVGQEYDITKPGIEGDIARAILEIASPIPKDDLELIKSPLAVKLLGTATYRLIVESKEFGGEDPDKQYRAMTEIVQDPTKIRQHKPEMARFRRLIERIRKTQLTPGRQTITIVTKQGLYIAINPESTKVRSGAYTKCGNASFAVNESADFHVYQPTKARGFIDVTNELMSGDLQKRFLSFSLAAGFTSKAEKKPTPKKGRKTHRRGKSTPGRKKHGGRVTPGRKPHGKGETGPGEIPAGGGA